MWDEGSFSCAFCGRPNYIQLDPSVGFEQDYVEDCQSCCQPNQIHVTFDPQTLEAEIWAEMEAQ